MILQRRAVCLLALAGLICLVSPVLSQPSRRTTASVDETIESQAIKEVIRKVHECFLRNDFDCWKQYRIQTEYESLYVYDGRSITSWEGWKAVELGARQFWAGAQVVPNLKKYEELVEESNLRFHFFSPNVASVTWDQYSKIKNYRSKEARTMERVNSQWKIAAQYSFLLPLNPQEKKQRARGCPLLDGKGRTFWRCGAAWYGGC